MTAVVESRTASSASRSNGAPAAAPVSSRVLKQFANQLRAGRHPVVVGEVADLVLFQGEAAPLPDVLVRQACSVFDVVVRVNGVNEIEVVKGGAEFARLETDSHDGQHVDDTTGEDLDEREARVRALTRRPRREDPIELIRRVLTQTEVSVAAIVEQADILLQDPAHHTEAERHEIATLQLAMRQAARVGPYRNTCALLTSEHQYLPPVLLAGSDHIGVIEVERPTRDERAAFIESQFETMFDTEDLDAAERAGALALLIMLTEGDSLLQLESLTAFSQSSRLSPVHARRLVSLHRFGDRPDYWSTLADRLTDVEAMLRSRVFGQTQAIDKVMRVLAAIALGLRLTGDEYSHEGMPRGVLWFQGPTGVGKTELAKAIAGAVFGDDEAYVRLDMSTFAQQHAAERLLGAPPGYLGYEQGGELTNAVRRRPNSVILLDEIEKAHPQVLERFLSIFDDGRVTDAQGRVTYFNEAIIIATTNVGASRLHQLIVERGQSLDYDEIEAVGIEEIRNHFTSLGRPEIYGRIEPGVVVFDLLRPEMVERIVTKIATAVSFDNGPELRVDLASAGAMAQASLGDAEAWALGGRQVRNILQKRMRELAGWLVRNGHAGAGAVDVRFGEDGRVAVSVDGAPEVVAT